MKVIAISGYKRSGKDTIADYLVKNYGFSRVSFADPLKDLCSSEYDVERTHFDNPEFKEAALKQYPIEPKDAFTRNLCEFLFKEFVSASGKHPDSYTYVGESKFMGLFGTAGNYTQEQLYHCPRSLAILKGSTNRVVTPNYWVNAASRFIRFESQPHPTNRFIIPDLRYRSEIEGLQKTLKNLITIRVNRFDSVNSTDPSELDLVGYKNFNYEIDNKSSINDLFIKIDNIMEGLNVQKIKFSK